MKIDLLIKRPIFFFTVLFLIIQFITIILSRADNLVIIFLMNLFLILHFILWFYVGEFSDKSKMIKKGFFPPVFLLIIFSLFPFISNVLAYLGMNIVSGTIWINGCFIVGITPVAYRVFSIIVKIRLDKNFDDSILISKRKFNKKCKEKSLIGDTLEKFLQLIFILLLIIISPIIVNSIQYVLVDSEDEIAETVNGLTYWCTNDTEKVNTLLSWFDRGVGKCENMANVYYRRKQSDVNYLLNFAEVLFIYSKSPFFCFRGGDDFTWVWVTRCGMCQEYGTFFSKMADVAGVDVRKVVCKGEDHVWNEVKIDDEWIIVDSTAVDLPLKNGFNLNRSFMENKVKGDLRREGIMVENGNVSYVYAIAPNDLNKKIDVTSRYTDIINISIFVCDNDNIPLSNVSVFVSSNNRLKLRSTGLSNKTNEFGICNFTLGGGEYTFTAKKNSFSFSIKGSYSENISNYNETIIFNQSIDEFNKVKEGENVKVELIIQMLGLMGAILLSINVIIGRKGRLKVRNWFANHITKSRKNNRKVSAEIYERFFWKWEQFLGIIGLFLLLIALFLTLFLFFIY